MGDDPVDGAGSGSIYDLARECACLFDEYLSAPRIHSRFVEQNQRRFLSWVAFLGVFAPQDACLDARLKYKQDVRGLVMLLLNVLRRNMRRAIKAHTPGMKNVSEFNIEHPSDSDGAAYGIDGSIDRLHRLAVRIRQSSKEGLPERVRAFAKKNTSDGSEKMISEIIKYKYQHPLISERLLAHLTKTVIYRHHRLRYIQRHQGKLAEDRDHKTGGHTDQARNTGRGKGSETKPPIGATEASLEEPYSETSPSTMNTKVYNQQDNVKQAKPSTVAGSISSSWIGKISYPPPPANKDKSSHLICPYCFQEFQAKVLETTLSWRSHFDKDLEHYVCISDECKHSLHYFDNFDSWLEHMNETHTEAWSQYIYSTTWHCTLQHDYVPDSFQTADELYNHLEAVHREVSQSRELLALAQKSKVLEPRKADICPLCNESITQLTDHSVPVAYLEHDESGDTVASMTSEKKPSERTKTQRVGFANLNDLEGLDDKAKSKDSRIQSIQTPENPPGSSALRLKMAKHVAGHLKSLSFLSLRGVEQDVEDDASASHNAVHAVDEGGSGSDVERVTFGLDEPLLFDDISERRLLTDDEEQKENQEADFSLERPHDDPNWSFVQRSRDRDEDEDSILNHFREYQHKSFGESIREALQRSAVREGRNFLPINELERIVTKTRIRQELIPLPVAEDQLDYLTNQIWDVTSPSLSKFANRKTTRRKIFAILGLMEQVDQILHFIKENLYDSDLPFLLSEGPRKGARQLKRKDNDGNLHEIYLFAQWKTYELEAFDTFQWQLVAPYFHLSTQLEAKILHYSLENHVILPFIEDHEIRHSGGYGDVWRIKIHPAHHNFCKDSASIDENPSFAIKRLRHNSNDAFHAEVSSLKRFSAKDHIHLIRLLVTFSWREQYYLLFPWADGNLMDFWRLYPRPSDLERDYGFTLWFAEQCLGVAKGLQMIHTLDVPDTEGLDSRSRHQIHGRHGDLKPENILWFKAYQKGDQIQQMGVLKISDFGLTRFHRTMSRSHISSDSLAVSPTYRAPEYDVCKMVSQSYDIWTLACILLEFITWYLLGWQEVDTFARKRIDEDNSMIKEDTFFNFVNIKDESGRVQTGAKAKQSVANEFRQLYEHHHCSDYIYDFLQFIEKRLLRMGPQKRADCNEVVEKLTAFYSACSSDRQYCIQRIRLPPRHLTNSGSDLSLLSPAPLDFTPETDKLIRRKSLHGYAGPMETDSSITDTGSFATDLVATSSRNDTLPDAVPPEPARMDTVIESLHISQPESPPPRKVHFPPSRSRPGSIQDFQISAEDNEQMEIPESTEMPPRPIVPATSMLSLPSSSTSEPSQMMAPKPSSRSYDVEPQSSQQESSPSEPQVKGPEPSPSRSGDVELQSSQSSQILQQEPPAQSKSLRKRLQRLFRNRRYLD